MTHAAGGRWKHLAPYVEHLRPDDVDAAILRVFVEEKRRAKRQPVGERAPKEEKLAPS